MAGETRLREVLLGGGVMLGLGGGFLTAEYVLTGQLPSGAPGLLFWGMAAFGAVRTAIGLGSMIPARPARQPVAATPPVLQVEEAARAEAPLNDFEYAYSVLGLTPDASLREVRQAFREQRGYWLNQLPSPRTTFELAEVQAAYRLLRHVLGQARSKVPLMHFPAS